MKASELLTLALIALVSFGLSYVGAAVGLVLGHLRLVLLLHVLGSAVTATATNAAISAAGALYGAVHHGRQGRISLALFLTIGVPSALASHAAARYAVRAEPGLLKLLIASAVFLGGAHMLWRGHPERAQHRERTIETAISPKGAILVEVLVGTVLGAVTGLVGLLLGSLRLPAMMRIGRATPAVVVGTNMAIGALTGFSVAVTGFLAGKVHLLAFAVVMPPTLVGARLGARMTGRLAPAVVVKWAGYALIFSSAIMLAELAFAR